LGLPFGGSTFNGSTPTNTQYDTTDIAAQYDGWSDFPVNPLNLLAVANAMMGVDYLHLGGTYDNTTLTDPGVVDQGQYQDTHYYLISTPVLPLLMPLEKFGPLGHALADTMDAPLRVIVESAYDRTTSPGVPTSWKLTYFPDPIKFTRNLLVSIPTGWDNGIQDLAGVRPFRTTRPGPYGVGGPDVNYTSPDTTSTDSTTTVAAKESTAETTAKKSTAGVKPHPATATKAAAAAATTGGSDKDSSSKSTTSKSTTSTTSKHNNGVGGSKRAKAAAGAAS